MRTLRHALAALAAGALIASAHVSAQSPSLDELLVRTATYVAAFIPQFANIVAVESYEQRSRQTGGNGRLTPSVPWRLKSDVLLVRHPASPLDWMWFRDVGEVDGRRVRREPDRLMKLFAEGAADAVERAAQISYEGAQFHLGAAAVATTNPLLVLALMQPHYQPRLRFTPGDVQRSSGSDVQVIRFEEREELAASGARGADKLPPLLKDEGRVTGTVSVEVETGRIVRTEARMGQPPRIFTNATTFVYDTRFGLSVPKEMRTRWPRDVGVAETTVTAAVEGIATYGNFRRFDVRTDSTIGRPRQP